MKKVIVVKLMDHGLPKNSLKGRPTTISQSKQIGNGVLGLNYDYYYWLNKNGDIRTTSTLPEVYKLISHISELKSTKLFKLL